MMIVSGFSAALSPQATDPRADSGGLRDPGCRQGLRVWGCEGWRLGVGLCEV